QKSLYLRNDQLVAGHLQGANAALEEKVFWVPNRAFEPARLPVILGIQNGTRCLASPPASQPTLQLQKVFWVPNRAFEPARLPVILGIQNGTRCLASPPASQPTLQLQ
ncbi:PREDICTED: interleukin-36 receptor antagonist protein-like, partial [Mesitornis unicolor]|uniref:interleukin-36 receptor antagonist protein-like n=1 Tax=Mesitornis unicolor TaxID=54374 RepID=UPI00052911E5